MIKIFTKGNNYNILILRCYISPTPLALLMRISFPSAILVSFKLCSFAKCSKAANANEQLRSFRILSDIFFGSFLYTFKKLCSSTVTFYDEFIGNTTHINNTFNFTVSALSGSTLSSVRQVQTAIFNFFISIRLTCFAYWM